MYTRRLKLGSMIVFAALFLVSCLARAHANWSGDTLYDRSEFRGSRSDGFPEWFRRLEAWGDYTILRAPVTTGSFTSLRPLRQEWRWLTYSRISIFWTRSVIQMNPITYPAWRLGSHMLSNLELISTRARRLDGARKTRRPGCGFCIPESDLGRITGWAFVCSLKARRLALKLAS